MTQLYTTSAPCLALRRLPALSITLGLELLGAVIIDQLHQVIKIYTLIVSFMPAISALSGNLGLQASANTIRGLGTGQTLDLPLSRHCLCNTFFRSYRLFSVFCQHDEGDKVRASHSNNGRLNPFSHQWSLGLL